MHPKHIVIDLDLPDRPGALGAVASRFGAVGANITDLAFLGASPTGGAHDRFHLTFPDVNVDLIALLHAELAEVDGVTVIGWHTSSCCHSDGLRA